MLCQDDRFAWFFELLTAPRQFVVLSGSEKSLVNWFRDPSVASLCQDDRFVWFFELLTAPRQFVILSGSEKSLVNWFRDPSRSFRMTGSCGFSTPHRFAELSPPLFIEEGDRLRWRSLHEERFDAVSRVEFARGALFRFFRDPSRSFRMTGSCGSSTPHHSAELLLSRGALYFLSMSKKNGCIGLITNAPTRNRRLLSVKSYLWCLATVSGLLQS